jgi:hypothetical protein
MFISESATPVCAQKARLLRLCALAESHHQRAIQGLARFIGKLKKSDFEELLEFWRDHKQDRGSGAGSAGTTHCRARMLTMVKPT